MAANTFDDLLLPGQPLAEAHPDRLAMIAMLFGMHPESIGSCRVLDLRCAAGEHLIPLASALPGSSFLGIDDSPRQIELARATAASLGLNNVEFRRLPIGEIDDSFGQFDYLVGHGLFSSIAPVAQESLLAVCKSRLAPQGVAYLSYNTFPAWHFRNVIRKLAQDGTASKDPPAQRVAALRRLLEFFRASVGDEVSPYNRMLVAEIDAALRQSDRFLFHEFVADENHPLYFHEFMERVGAHGLQYLGEAVISTMFPDLLGAEIEKNVARVARDLMSTEQQLDLLRNRSFRQTLLCHNDIALVRHLTPDALETLHLAANLRPESAYIDLASHSAARFAAPRGQIVESTLPAVKAALWHISGIWPRAASFEELASAAQRCLTDNNDPTRMFGPQDREMLGQDLLQCVAGGLIEAYTQTDQFTTIVHPTPRVTALARLQAQRGGAITNQRHESVQLDTMSRNVLLFLDGGHDRAAMLSKMTEAVERGELSILRNGIPANRGDEVSKTLEEALDQSLAKLASQALLIE